MAPVSKDITRRTHSAAPGCDIYIAGYPCPSFSALGKRKGTGDSRGLIGLHGLRYICEHRPRVCVLENVKGLLREKHQEFTRLFKDIFRTLQYKTYAKVLNSKDYAIPQSRPRVYIVAVLSSAMQSKFRWPKPIQHSKRSLSKFGRGLGDRRCIHVRAKAWRRDLGKALHPGRRQQPEVSVCSALCLPMPHALAPEGAPIGLLLAEAETAPLCPGGRPAARLAPQVARQIADAV